MSHARRLNLYVPSIKNAPQQKITHLSENTVNVSTMEIGKLGQLLTQMMCKTSGPAYWDKLKAGENDALVELPTWSAEYVFEREYHRTHTHTHSRTIQVQGSIAFVPQDSNEQNDGQD